MSSKGQSLFHSLHGKEKDGHPTAYWGCHDFKNPYCCQDCTWLFRPCDTRHRRFSRCDGGRETLGWRFDMIRQHLQSPNVWHSRCGQRPCSCTRYRAKYFCFVLTQFEWLEGPLTHSLVLILSHCVNKAACPHALYLHISYEHLVYSMELLRNECLFVLN